VCLVFLVGCFDDFVDDGGSDSGLTPTKPQSFSPRPQVSTGCPTACVVNIDISTTRGIPPACQRACPNVQTSSQCVAAGGAYDVYLKNGRAGADAGTLAQLYSQYQAQAQLANQVVSRLGC
jgi:hypothetical protein